MALLAATTGKPTRQQEPSTAKKNKQIKLFFKKEQLLFNCEPKTQGSRVKRGWYLFLSQIIPGCSWQIRQNISHQRGIAQTHGDPSVDFIFTLNGPLKEFLTLWILPRGPREKKASRHGLSVYCMPDQALDVQMCEPRHDQMELLPRHQNNTCNYI